MDAVAEVAVARHAHDLGTVDGDERGEAAAALLREPGATFDLVRRGSARRALSHQQRRGAAGDQCYEQDLLPHGCRSRRAAVATRYKNWRSKGRATCPSTAGNYSRMLLAVT
jgi:hypothetical protein